MARGPSQGEALATWALWGLITLCVIVTYSRIDPSETYHVSREGIAGGLSRAVTLVNFPFGLVAIALVLIAVAALPRTRLVGRGASDRSLRDDPVVQRAEAISTRTGGTRSPRSEWRSRLALTVAATRRAGPVLRTATAVGRRRA